MVAVVDFPVSMGQFCLSKSGFTCLSTCLVCSHTANFCSPMSHANHGSPIPHVFCGGTFREVANQVS